MVCSSEHHGTTFIPPLYTILAHCLHSPSTVIRHNVNPIYEYHLSDKAFFIFLRCWRLNQGLAHTRQAAHHWATNHASPTRPSQHPEKPPMHSGPLRQWMPTALTGSPCCLRLVSLPHRSSRCHLTDHLSVSPFPSTKCTWPPRMVKNAPSSGVGSHVFLCPWSFFHSSPLSPSSLLNPVFLGNIYYEVKYSFVHCSVVGLFASADQGIEAGPCPGQENVLLLSCSPSFGMARTMYATISQHSGQDWHIVGVQWLLVEQTTKSCFYNHTAIFFITEITWPLVQE